MKKEIVEDLIMNLKDAGCDEELITQCINCLLYTSDAADE